MGNLCKKADKNVLNDVDLISDQKTGKSENDRSLEKNLLQNASSTSTFSTILNARENAPLIRIFQYVDVVELLLNISCTCKKLSKLTDFVLKQELIKPCDEVYLDLFGQCLKKTPEDVFLRLLRCGCIALDLEERYHNHVSFRKYDTIPPWDASKKAKQNVLELCYCNGYLRSFQTIVKKLSQPKLDLKPFEISFPYLKCLLKAHNNFNLSVSHFQDMMNREDWDLISKILGDKNSGKLFVYQALFTAWNDGKHHSSKQVSSVKPPIKTLFLPFNRLSKFESIHSIFPFSLDNVLSIFESKDILPSLLPQLEPVLIRRILVLSLNSGHKSSYPVPILSSLLDKLPAGPSLTSFLSFLASTDPDTLSISYYPQKYKLYEAMTSNSRIIKKLCEAYNPSLDPHHVTMPFRYDLILLGMARGERGNGVEMLKWLLECVGDVGTETFVKIQSAEWWEGCAVLEDCVWNGRDSRLEKSRLSCVVFGYVKGRRREDVKRMSKKGGVTVKCRLCGEDVDLGGEEWRVITQDVLLCGERCGVRWRRDRDEEETYEGSDED